MKAQSFPSPVLNNGDDLGGAFKCNLRWEQKDGLLLVEPVELDVTNRSLKALIDKGAAKYVLQAYSAQSLFRKTYDFTKAGQVIEIPVSRARDRLDLTPFVCATERIASYEPEGLGEDLAGLKFKVEPGEILAIEKTSSLVVESVYNLAKPKSKSFIKIREGNFDTGPFRCQFNTDKIYVDLSKRDFQRYLRVRNQFPAVVHATIVFPVLAQALALLDGEDAGDFNNLSWATRLEHLRQSAQISRDSKDYLDIAQRLLKDPFARGADDMGLMLNRIEKESE